MVVVAGALPADAAAAKATIYRCTDERGHVFFEQTACPVGRAPAASQPLPPPCPLSAEQKPRLMREETQFLNRYPDEASHRQAQWNDLRLLVDKVRGARSRFIELKAIHEELMKEVAFHPNGVLPPGVRVGLENNTARLNALVDVFRNLKDEFATLDARYRCQRDTYAKLWAGAAPGSSGCGRPACAP